MRFVFVSSNRAWGGSEELWSATAAVLAERGHAITVYKIRPDDHEPRIRRLRELSCTIRDLASFPIVTKYLYAAAARMAWTMALVHEMARLRMGLLASRRPDLVVVSQGGNYDGELLAEVCRRMGLPYVLISQKASDLYWPTDARMPKVRRVYQAARACFFVAEHNRRLTQEQLGVDLTHSEVVRNPFLVSWERRSDWPDEDDGFRLACIGRLYPMEKGQDLLLRVLARERWRARPVTVTFFGTGQQKASLTQMAEHLKLTNVRFAGFVRDIGSVWNDHHGLILPSRCEGLPLVLVEAMLSGRVPIVTDVGGSGEVIEEGVTGFLAPAPTEDVLDETMERAWIRRDAWRGIGAEAADRIRTLVPPDPAAVLADRLHELAGR